MFSQQTEYFGAAMLSPKIRE